MPFLCLIHVSVGILFTVFPPLVNSIAFILDVNVVGHGIYPGDQLPCGKEAILDSLQLTGGLTGTQLNG